MIERFVAVCAKTIQKFNLVFSNFPKFSHFHGICLFPCFYLLFFVNDNELEVVKTRQQFTNDNQVPRV